MNNFLPISIILFVSIVAGLQETRPALPDDGEVSTEHRSYELPVTSRSFFVGTAGFAPANFPRMNASDMARFWKDVETSSELHAVHVAWKDLQVLHVTAQSVSTDLVVGLGFQTPAEWKNDVEALKQTIKVEVLGKYPQIKYLFIGNEVNDLYDAHPKEFDQFVVAYKDVYDFTKREFPAVKVFTTFQLESLLGAAHMRGTPRRDPQWFIVEKFEDHFDLFGLTTYPYFEYTQPQLIPETYYSQLTQHTAKPLAITEVGWMSRENFGGRLKPLSEQGYTGSEDEQARFVQRLTQLVQPVDMEFINWLHINDFAAWEDGDVPKNVGLAAFLSDALKNHDGTEKTVWRVWLNLKQLPKQ